MLGFFGFFCAYATRGCINVAIVVMVNSTDDDGGSGGQFVNGSADRCPPHNSQNVTVGPSPQVSQARLKHGAYIIISCSLTQS